MGKKTNVKVKPRAKGLLVRYPGTNAPLPEEGAVVPWTGKEGRYWRRRMNCGDIVLVGEEAQEDETQDEPSNNTDTEDASTDVETEDNDDDLGF